MFCGLEFRGWISPLLRPQQDRTKQLSDQFYQKITQVFQVRKNPSGQSCSLCDFSLRAGGAFLWGSMREGRDLSPGSPVPSDAYITPPIGPSDSRREEFPPTSLPKRVEGIVMTWNALNQHSWEHTPVLGEVQCARETRDELTMSLSSKCSQHIQGGCGPFTPPASAVW